MAELELTDREIAIAKGEDPDAVSLVTPDDESLNGEAGGDSVIDNERDAEFDNESADDETDSQGDREVAMQPGSKDAASESRSGNGGQSKPASSEKTWLDDSVRQLGRSLEMTDEELAEFGSREEFDRATRILSKRFFSAGGQQAGANGQGQPNQGQQATGQQQTTQPGQQSGQQQSGQQDDPLSMFDPEEWRKAGYDEKTVAMVESHRQTLIRLAQQEESQKHIINGLLANQKSRFEDEFDSVLDSQEKELFGQFFENGQRRVLDPKSNEYQNRAKVWEAYHILVGGIRQRAEETGRQVELPPTKVLIEQAKRVALGDQLSKLESRRLSEKVREQSKRRRPAATHRTATTQTRNNAKQKPTATTTADQIDDLLDNPELKAMWDRMQDDNG